MRPGAPLRLELFELVAAGGAFVVVSWHEALQSRKSEKQKAGNLSEAEQIYRKILSENPQHAHALHMMGLIAFEIKQYDVAGELIHKAIEAQPSDTFWDSLGNVHKAQQKYNEAISYFAKASSLKPTDYLAVENIGLCYYSATDYKNAITYFDKVLQNYNPTDGKSEFLKGISLLNLGNNPDGCVFLKRSMAKGFPQAAQQVSTYCK